MNKAEIEKAVQEALESYETEMAIAFPDDARAVPHLPGNRIPHGHRGADAYGDHGRHGACSLCMGSDQRVYPGRC